MNPVWRCSVNAKQMPLPTTPPVEHTHTWGWGFLFRNRHTALWDTFERPTGFLSTGWNHIWSIALHNPMRSDVIPAALRRVGRFGPVDVYQTKPTKHRTSATTKEARLSFT